MRKDDLENMDSLECYVVYLCLCISCLLIQTNEAAVPTDSFYDCENSTTFTANTSYGSNLQSLLSSLSSYEATKDPFYTTVGREVQNMVFGLIMCRGDIMNTLICQECVRNASSEISRRCREKKQAIIWYDECMLRYSDKPIYGILDQTSPKFLPSSNSLKEENDGIELLWAGMINSLALQAAGLPKKFAVREESEDSYSQTLYGLVQCTPDLSGSDCTSCFQKAIAATPVAYKGHQGGRVLLPNCFIRYEFFRFFNYTEASPPPILSPPPPGKNKISSAIIITIVASIIASCLLFGMGYYFLHARATKKYNALIQENAAKGITSSESMQFSFKSIEIATSNFSDCNKLGKGGFGEVYKGILVNGREIAVKRLSKNSGQGAEEFKNEVVLVAKLQHRNLVRLLGFCLEGEEKLLVYEYVPNKSLDYFLFDPKKRDQLDWSIRCNIIGGIARGILYLHEDSRLKVIHRDLKASNVLLDRNMNPKISDFGMAKMFGVDQIQGNTARIVGTYGYMAPEYAMEGLYSIKSDVFSFGVLLLEILSGRRNTGFHLIDCAPSLVQYAWQLWNESKGLELLDPLMTDSCPPIEFLRYVHIGLLCVQEDANKRPTMSTVILMLKSESLSLAQPQRPAFFVGRFTENNEIGIEICSVNAVTISDFLPR